MGSVCPPPSLPGPNWGGLTSWPQLNWVVVPVASVSFPVSQGGLHSHCVQHCIVQAGCNQADESCISKNALRVFFFPPCWRNAVRYLCTQTSVNAKMSFWFFLKRVHRRTRAAENFYHLCTLERSFTQVWRVTGRACAHPSCCLSLFSFRHLRETNPAPNQTSFFPGSPLWL